MRLGRLVATLLLIGLASAEERVVSVEATLKRAPGAWWKEGIPGGERDGTLVSWGITFVGEDSPVPVRLPASAQCQKDPFCTSWTTISRQCEELFGHGHDQWDARYSCYAANRTLFFDREEEIYSGPVPEGIEEVRIDFYDRDDSYRRRRWERSRVVIRLTDDITRLDVSVELVAGSGGEPRRLRASCEPTSSDSAALAERLRAGKLRHCTVERVEDHLPEP